MDHSVTNVLRAQAGTHAARAPATAAITAVLRSLRFFQHEPFAAVGAAIYVVIAIAAVFAPQLAPYDPRAMLREGHRIARYLPISRAHWLGTTAGGYDVFSQLVYGARAALEVGLTAAIAVVAIGTAAWIAGRLPWRLDRQGHYPHRRHRAGPAVPALHAGAGRTDHVPACAW